jgi:hypothetical protein
MLTQQKIAFAKNKNKIGSTLTCLVDSVDNGPDAPECRGRFYGQAPDIDSVCIIKSQGLHTKNCSVKVGRFVNTRVFDTRDYDLLVEEL